MNQVKINYNDSKKPRANKIFWYENSTTEKNQRTLRILGWRVTTQFKKQLIYFLKNSNKGCSIWQLPTYHA